MIDTAIVGASWTPNPFIERAGAANAAGGRRKRQANTLTFDLDIRVHTNVGASGINGDNLWTIDVYLSGDEDCASVNEATVVHAVITPQEANQDLLPGGVLLFDLNGIMIPVDNVLCENARYVCAKLGQTNNPSNDFTLVGVPDELALAGSYALDCKG